MIIVKAFWRFMDRADDWFLRAPLWWDLFFAVLFLFVIASWLFAIVGGPMNQKEADRG